MSDSGPGPGRSGSSMTIASRRRLSAWCQKCNGMGAIRFPERRGGATMRSRTMIAILILTQLLWSGWADAALYPQPPAASPFRLTGFIQAMTLDAEGMAGDPLAGGTVTVNGTTVVIPRNTIVLMPGTFLSWQELWDQAPPPWGLTSQGRNGQTGLAMSDSFTDPASGVVT